MIGCYTGEYFGASFKGVPFLALEVTSEHGRRGAEGEFPFSEQTAYADLGRKIRRFTLSGRLQENSHIRDAAALIMACEMPGPGLLMHPTRGALTVACTRLTVTDNPEESRGVTEVSMEFVEANFMGAGFIFSALAGIISLVSITAAVRDSVSRNYFPDVVRWYQAPQVVFAARDSISQIRTQYDLATATTRTDKTFAILADFDTVIDDAFTVRTADTYTRVLSNGMAYLDSATEGAAKVNAFRKIANWAAKSSPLAAEAAQSQNSVYSATRILAAGYMVRGMLEQQPGTLDAALQSYDTITRILEEEAAIANTECHDPNLFLALRDFIIEAQTALLSRAYDLPALVEYKFKGGTHSLIAAYEIYGDAKQFGELEARNTQYSPWAFGPKVIASRAAQ